VQKPQETSLESNKKNAGKRKISAEVKKVLDKAELVADDLEVRLPPEQLSTALYEAVNAVIEDYGGKWNKRRKCYVLKNAEDFKKFQEALETGVSMNQRTAKQAFYTPAALAQQMIKLANVQPHDRVLEPSAGIGNIAGWMVQLGAEVDCIETDPVAVKHLRELKFNVIYEMDFLKVPPKAKYDKIVMNPPFAKGQDVKHVLHALRFLKPGGRLVSIVSPGLMTSKTKEAVHLQEIVAKYGYPHDVPAGTFKESGTNVATILIEIRLPTSTSC
jgi:protein-L-isoaspartate O-methyltransferase